MALNLRTLFLPLQCRLNHIFAQFPPLKAFELLENERSSALPSSTLRVWYLHGADFKPDRMLVPHSVILTWVCRARCDWFEPFTAWSHLPRKLYALNFIFHFEQSVHSNRTSTGIPNKIRTLRNFFHKLHRHCSQWPVFFWGWPLFCSWLSQMFSIKLQIIYVLCSYCSAFHLIRLEFVSKLSSSNPCILHILRVDLFLNL